MNPFKETLLQITSGLSGGVGLLIMAFLLVVIGVGFKERIVPLVVVGLLLELVIAGMYMVK
jgi:hypothetical protein